MNLDNFDLIRSHIHNFKLGIDTVDKEIYLELLESYLETEEKDDMIKALEYDIDSLENDLCNKNSFIDDLEDENYDLKSNIDDLENQIQELQEALEEAKSKGFV